MKNAFTAVLIVLALVIFVIFWDSPPEVFLSKDKSSGATLPQANSYMINSETRKFNEQGLETFVLNTTRGQFFKQQNRFVMDKPRVRADGETPDQAPWWLTANTGVVHNQGERVVMHGKVRAWQEAPRGKTRLKTTVLTFYPDQDLAETDRKVFLSSPGSSIVGVGMKANLEQQTFELLSQVKSKHDAIH